MSLCPGLIPREFRDDVVRVARNRDDGVTIEQIATDFGVHPMTLHEVDAPSRYRRGRQAR